jgi:hypothetical protein
VEGAITASGHLAPTILQTASAAITLEHSSSKPTTVKFFAAHAEIDVCLFSEPLFLLVFPLLSITSVWHERC